MVLRWDSKRRFVRMLPKKSETQEAKYVDIAWKDAIIIKDILAL